jgi:putative nucleotidyltransferase with HDIG domain
MSDAQSAQPIRRRVFFILLLAASIALALLAILLPSLLTPALPAPQEGQVALSDYRSPVSIQFTSQVVTEQRREAASRSVQPIYTPPDTQIARRQLESLSTTLAYITSVRADTHASQQQKLEDLAALEEIRLSQDTALTILNLTDARWQMIQQEASDVLEQLMSREIHPDTVEDARQRAALLVSLSFPERQAAAIAELAAGFVTANSDYSETLTEAARQKARDAIAPYKRSLVAGETIIAQGQIFTNEDIESLQQVGLAQPEQKMPNLISASVLVMLLTVFLVLYFRRERVKLTHDPRSMTLVVLLFLVFAITARLTIPARTVIPYAFPLAAYSLIIAALFGGETAMISSLPLAILVAYGLPNALDLTLYYIFGSLVGVLVLRRAQRISAYLYAGAAVTVAGSAVILVYRLPVSDTIGIATLLGAALFNGLASASITLLLQFALAQFLGMTTPMQLMELSRPDQPLLQVLLRDAPGTYQHSLQVANLAEQAAERIGGDPLLTRVGALYHDIGKTLNPMYFIENQLPGFVNPHDNLEPRESAEVIIQHVSAGLELARKYRLPRPIQNFITEHHGTLITRYQYVRAVQAAQGDESQVGREQFRYPGPQPQSRETAILMLADGCEARVRAERPNSEEGVRKTIREVIDERARLGQLDNTRLTMRDLNVIAESFATTLRGIYHLRVKYPRLDQTDSQEITRPHLEKPTLPAVETAPPPTDSAE